MMVRECTCGSPYCQGGTPECVYPDGNPGVPSVATDDLTQMRRFQLHRDEDVSGVSGVGVVAEGVAFSGGGPVAMRWTSEWPTSVVFHDRGVESLEAVHGHNGRTRIVWLDPSGEG